MAPKKAADPKAAAKKDDKAKPDRDEFWSGCYTSIEQFHQSDVLFERHKELVRT